MYTGTSRQNELLTWERSAFDPGLLRKMLVQKCAASKRKRNHGL